MSSVRADLVSPLPGARIRGMEHRWLSERRFRPSAARTPCTMLQELLGGIIVYTQSGAFASAPRTFVPNV
eukprot:6272163-Pyramimonas_sp.AAC.1